MEEVLEYLRECGTFYLATMDDDQPRVRPFGALGIFEGKLYTSTSNVKNVFAQMIKNPKVEISGMAKDGSWIRLTAIAVRDDRIEARQHLLEDNPSLKSLYAADDGKYEVFYLKNATAVISSFTGQPKTIQL
jgi:uncharacterized pyridoxamine 5'-phosphate oxidase family protein